MEFIKPKTKYFTVVILLVIVSAFFISRPVYLVRRVIGGDTIELANGWVVELIGIDAPESEINSKMQEDSKRTGYSFETLKAIATRAKSQLEDYVNNRYVELEYDRQKKDANGHRWAYVYVDTGWPLGFHYKSQGGAYLVKRGFWGKSYIFVNASLMGHHRVYPISPNTKYASLFESLNKSVQEYMRSTSQDGFF